MKSKPSLSDVEFQPSSGAGNARPTRRRQEHYGNISSSASIVQGSSDEPRHSRPRRSLRHQRHALAGEADKAWSHKSADSSSESPPAHSQTTTISAGNENTSNLLLWALAKSTTADSVAVAMIKGSHSANEPQNQEKTTRSNSTVPKPRISIFHSPSANKLQLKATFHSIFYPKQLLTSFVPILFLLLNVQPSSDVQLAEHALHLAQLGTTSKDERAVREALRVYQATVIQLRRRLSQPNAVLNDQVFAVVHLLRICETYSAISHDESGRRRHHEGIGQLLVAKGPKPFNHVKSLPLRISLEIYQQSQLWELLAARRKGHTSTPEWTDLTRDDKCKWRLPQLTSFVLQLPEILQRADDLITGKEDAAEGDVLDSLSEIKGFEGGLRRWMSRWYVENPGVPYRKVKMETCPWMKPLTDRKAPPVFASAYEFAGTATAKAHQLFWMALLASSEATKDLADLLPDPLPPHSTYEEQESRLLDEINESADNLCMTAVYMSQPDNGVDSWIDACHCLQFASLWYEKSGLSDKRVWCKNMIEAIESRGIRAPVLIRRRKLPK
ncbi:hypothetical protein M409DRAFT_57344 [Zasmidium cellare ATCC 36951]|uniref:Uncharacterized protein n=1 Tax=Zasmidium cellare ATCC 36951 TaxID=1080233 RepID=A0A6A6CDB5_ZASCE|nr:uncharacterized protein M409DRAFT_57344 [Zasmidium cellare ATCC 36951]KAF2163436.1 hypothetical protein M409DRAFT_57344 [Zasmidium cellare ATCC 36951]